MTENYNQNVCFFHTFFGIAFFHYNLSQFNNFISNNQSFVYFHVCYIYCISDDIFVSCEELHAQVCFDLGSLHFTHNYYEKAGEMFGHVRLVDTINI